MLVGKDNSKENHANNTEHEKMEEKKEWPSVCIQTIPKNREGTCGTRMDDGRIATWKSRTGIMGLLRDGHIELVLNSDRLEDWAENTFIALLYSEIL